MQFSRIKKQVFGPLCIALAIALWLSLTMFNTAKAQTVSVGITPVTFKVLQSHLDLKGQRPTILERNACPHLKSEKIDGIGRALVELFILCNAIYESGIATKIELIHHLPHRRRLTEIAAGRIDVSGSTIFPEGLKNVFGKTLPLLSDDVLWVNEFEKAIFTLPGRAEVLAVRSLQELRNFKAVIVKNWRVDVKTLKAIKLKRVVEVSNPQAYADIIQIVRADFIISEFNSVTSQPWAKNMMRVPGIKIALTSPRIFPVSPTRDDILHVLNSFLRKSRSAGGDLIKTAYQKSGFLSPEFSNWILLFPEN